MEIYYSGSKFQEIESVRIEDKIDVENHKRLHLIKNYKVFGHIIWQSNTLLKSIIAEYDAIFLLGDMKILTNWIIPLIARLRNKKVVYWTHGIYGNESLIKKTMRLVFLNLATDILLYENRAKKVLIKHGFNPLKLHVVFNSLDYNNQKKIFKNLINGSINSKSAKKRIVFIGRLTKVKKIEMLVNAIINLNLDKKNIDLIVIGEGSRKPYLEKIVNASEYKKNIKFLEVYIMKKK